MRADKLGFSIGTQVTQRLIDTVSYRGRLREFNLLLASELYWGAGGSTRPLRPDLTTWDSTAFANAEKIVAYAEQNGMRTRGFHLTWDGGDDEGGPPNPSWLVRGSFNRNDLIQIMQDHIRVMMGRFKGRIHEWTVVNEPYIRGSKAFWTSKIGRDYVDIAFETARTADPSAVLIYNDNANEEPGPRSDSNYRDVERLKSKGLVDTIGFQMHLNGAAPPKKEAVKSNLRRFIDLGVKAEVTEFDVSMKHVEGPQEERLQIQAQIYQSMLEAVLEAGGSGFCVFGIGDNNSWLQGPEQPDAGGFRKAPNSNPTPFDDSLRPKPAYTAMLDVLRKAALR